MVRAHKVVRGGLRCGIGAVGRVGRIFGESRVVRAKRTIDFIRGNMQKTELRPVSLVQLLPIMSRLLQQIQSALYIGPNELSWIVDGAIDVTFRGEMDHGARPVLFEQLGYEVSVANISLHERVPRVCGDTLEVAQVSGIGQLVEIDDSASLIANPMMHKIGAYESRAAGQKDRVCQFQNFCLFAQGDSASG